MPNYIPPIPAPITDYCWIKNSFGETEPYEVYMTALATATGNGTTRTDSAEYAEWVSRWPNWHAVGYPQNASNNGYSRDELNNVLHQYRLYVQPETPLEYRQRLQAEYDPAFDELDWASSGAARRRDFAAANDDAAGEQAAKEDIAAMSGDYMALLADMNAKALAYGDAYNNDKKPMLRSLRASAGGTHVKWCPICGSRTAVTTTADGKEIDACTYDGCPYVHEVN